MSYKNIWTELHAFLDRTTLYFMVNKKLFKIPDWMSSTSDFPKL